MHLSEKQKKKERKLGRILREDKKKGRKVRGGSGESWADGVRNKSC